MAALTFKTAVNDSTRFTSSRWLSAHFGLTPRKYQSGTIDVTGSIDPRAVTLWCAALSTPMAVAKRHGLRHATVALARKLSIVLHRMWMSGTDLRFGKEKAAAA